VSEDPHPSGKQLQELHLPEDYLPAKRPMPMWLAEEKAKMSTTPMDCGLQSGEIIYVPAGYRHGVINLADSIGVAFQGAW
jgi:hypothetical protein